MQSNADWRAHQDRARLAGVLFHNALATDTPQSAGVMVIPLSPGDQALASSGQFSRLSGAPSPARLTSVPIPADATAPALSLAILSRDLVYPLANLPPRDGQSSAEMTGEVFRLLASFCSDPLVLAQMGDAPWVRVEGAKVLGCDAAPADLRLVSLLAAAIMLAALITFALNTSADFTRFAELLRSRRHLGGPDTYEIAGPQELQDIVAAVNSYLEAERKQIENRAAVLSGVSHDLGTPATRLRLRSALIPDGELRQKLEADIDRMTGMIESVLTYTRAEMSVEDPRKLSLNALIDALVADYQDIGKPVAFRESDEVLVQGGRSLFMSRQGQTVMVGNREVVVTARPVLLQRAIGNLVDNALKFGRRATLSLEMDAETATIIVEDEGGDLSTDDIEALVAPFRRGENTAAIEGYGLGLTIVATIATAHGGSLTFEKGAKGLRARLTIQRS
ncbi:MAG: sensor histidine kinase [Rhodobacteraceae bacterium]|nr:sensor histidine kinase [Paracoccaceae bacterium]